MTVVQSEREASLAQRRIGAPGRFDAARAREDFPILAPAGARQAARLPRQRGDHPEAPRRARGDGPLLRSAQNANVHRGVHLLSEAATKAYEGARRAVARFIGAPDRAR